MALEIHRPPPARFCKPVWAKTTAAEKKQPAWPVQSAHTVLAGPLDSSGSGQTGA